MEQWAYQAIMRHNTLMQAALTLVAMANGECSNTTSERLEAELLAYEVLPNGNMKTVPGDQKP